MSTSNESNLSLELCQSRESKQPIGSMKSTASTKSRESVNTHSSKVFVIETYVPPDPTYYVFLVDLKSPSSQGGSAIFVQREEENGDYIYPRGLDSTTEHTGGRLLGTTRKAFYSEIQNVNLESPSSESESYNFDWIKAKIIPTLKSTGFLTLTVQTVYMLEPEREFTRSHGEKF